MSRAARIQSAIQLVALLVCATLTPAVFAQQPRIPQYKDNWLVPLDRQGRGMAVSAPCVVGERVVIAIAHQKGLDVFGTLYCVDRVKKSVVWTFDDAGDMKQVYSSPCHADGRIYIGEGFHDDKNCKLYCVDALTGKKLWHFQTGGQTEASPIVAGGKVYFGAGNEGVYCLDAVTGKLQWRYGQEPNKTPVFRVCSGPAVVDGKLYVGSGVDRNQPDGGSESAIVCLDAVSGKQHWKTPLTLPAWATPVVVDERVYCGIGNGDILTEDPRPAGKLLCLEARTGKVLWEHKAGAGVLEKPSVDSTRVFFGSRDGHCYCVNRLTGKFEWKHNLGSPVVASPVHDGSPTTMATAVYAMATKGLIRCLDSRTGKAHWSYLELVKHAAHLSASPTLLVEPLRTGVRRQLLFAVTLQELTYPALGCVEDLLPAP